MLSTEPAGSPIGVWWLEDSYMECILEVAPGPPERGGGAGWQLPYPKSARWDIGGAARITSPPSALCPLKIWVVPLCVTSAIENLLHGEYMINM